MINIVELPSGLKGLDDYLLEHSIDEFKSLPTIGVKEPYQLNQRKAPGVFDEIKQRYPKKPFSWSVLPPSLADSLKQLARACATGSDSLPGVAFAILASVIGWRLNVSLKRSWCEPLIFWVMNIQASGQGKTPATRAMCTVLYGAQSEANEKHEKEVSRYQSLPKKEQKLHDPPKRARGYFCSDLTMEGLRNDISDHGGTIVVMDELSSIIVSQNQYKQGKGADREALLCLFDGHPARVVRAKETYYIKNSRVSICGGIQPDVWRKTFKRDNGGVYLSDGTIFRFLPTIGGHGFYPLTLESWTDENREAWESLLRKTMKWADESEHQKTLHLSQKAQDFFVDWRNSLYQNMDEFPEQIKGFVPKLVGYALRFSGVLYVMHQMASCASIGTFLEYEDILRGTKVSEFYLGHIVESMAALQDNSNPDIEVTEQVLLLAKTLELLRDDLDEGRVSVGCIQERFNSICPKGQTIKTPKGMGALLRKCGLTIPEGRFRYKGVPGRHCLLWDKKIEAFFKKTSTTSTMSTKDGGQGLGSVDTLKKQSPQRPQKL